MIRYDDQILEMATTTIAKNILLYLSSNNLEQANISKKLNCDPSYISKMLRGDKKCSKAFVKEFCEEYNIPMDTINLSPERFIEYLKGDISYEEVIDMKIRQFQKKKTLTDTVKEEDPKVTPIYISKKNILIKKTSQQSLPIY